ncbi:MAG: hypothetical protein PVI01_03880 [Gemmatimonadales bacterium]|jgi:hypothetical protein
MVRTVYPLLSVTVLSACVGSGVPHYFPVPEDAENPIKVEYAGATVPDVTNLVAKVCSDAGVSARQVLPDEGYVETRWADIAGLDLGSQAELYPPNERSVIYVFQATATVYNAGVLQIAGFYQPNRPRGTSPASDARYDRLLPTDHLGYQFALQLEWRLKQEFAKSGITVISDEQ